MIDLIELLYPSKYYRAIPKTITNYYINDDLIAAEKRSKHIKLIYSDVFKI
jgi:hypothetical protein